MLTRLASWQRSGLHSALLEYIDISRVAASRLLETCGEQLVQCWNISTQKANMNMPELVQLEAIEKKHLHRSLVESEVLFNTALESGKFESFVSIISLISGVAAVTGFLLWAKVYAPLASKLDREVRRTRSMLLLLPADIAKHSPSIGGFIKQHIKKF